ncbi:MAG: LysM peptidoglycan-binding domain-containing protein [Lachnospiraceae bacterium]|nr:LysM peptidoglycan-binding domain-containing protein [Lachnospiraceae bacterium]
MMKRRIAMAMAIVIVTLIMVLACIKFTARATIAENAARFSKKYYKSYLVESGDTLWTIAESECGSRWNNNWDYIDEVMLINGLKSETIKAGNYLMLPYYT